jgi:hypothetical protein
MQKNTAFALHLRTSLVDSENQCFQIIIKTVVIPVVISVVIFPMTHCKCGNKLKAACINELAADPKFSISNWNLSYVKQHFQMANIVVIFGHSSGHSV